MARWLRDAARHVGPAVAQGGLYRVAAYPGFVPGEAGDVAGDLFALADPGAVLAALDDYEDCAAHFARPHEYRRDRLPVRGETGPVAAWTYHYNRAVAGLERLGRGVFLS